MLSDSSDYFVDMLGVLFWVLAVNEDVVEVDNHEHVKEVGEDVIHEVLEGCKHICKPEGHHTPFKGSVADVTHMPLPQVQTGNMISSSGIPNSYLVPQGTCPTLGQAPSPLPGIVPHVVILDPAPISQTCL